MTNYVLCPEMTNTVGKKPRKHGEGIEHDEQVPFV